MASKREKIKMKSSKSHYYYYTEKNKTNSPERLTLMKYDPSPDVRAKVEFKEAR